MGRQEVIEESIRLRIAQAQFALLRRDGAIYRAGLQAALDGTSALGRGRIRGATHQRIE